MPLPFQANFIPTPSIDWFLQYGGQVVRQYETPALLLEGQDPDLGHHPSPQPLLPSRNYPGDLQSHQTDCIHQLTSAYQLPNRCFRELGVLAGILWIIFNGIEILYYGSPNKTISPH